MRVLRATRTSAANVTFYAAALGAVALAGQANLPPEFSFFFMGVGVNAVSSILERLARGEDISDEEIMRAILAAIKDTRIEQRLTSADTQSMIARLFRRFDVLQSTLQQNEFTLLQRLTDQAGRYETVAAQLREGIADIYRVVSAISEQNAEIFGLQRQLRDLLAAIHVAAVPPPVPLHRPRRAEHFTGRETELGQLVADLQPGRVVTLCGPGGIGKTALAAEAVWHLAPGGDPPDRFPDGIIFHTFYTEAQAALALEAIARAYGEDPRPTPADAARRALSRRCALLVLDGAENADDLDAVLSIAGGCGVLITTRRHHDAPGHWHDVAPLPNLKAVELLQAWGGDFAADQSAAARICELVGGLPLAVTLAGKYLAQRRQDAADYLAWLQDTPLAALDFGDRQRDSVPLLLERSLAQVSDSARRTLAVVGLLDLAAFAREIIPRALDVPEADANRSLGELVDYGLLLRTGQRYQVSHALVHTYARQRLPQPADALARLAAYYDALAREQSALGPPGFAVLDLERAHVLAIQSACLAAQQWEQARRLTWAIEDYLDLQGHSTERVTVIEAGLAAARASEARYDEGAFLTLLGLAYAARGEYRRAIEYHEQALTILREIGDRRGEGAALGNLGNAYHSLGEYRRAIEYHEQDLTIAREIGDRRGEGQALGNLGNAHYSLGEYRRAIEYYEQHMTIAREIGDRQGEGNALGNLGNAYHSLGEYRRAIEYHEQALAIDREIGDRRGEGAALGNLGNAYYSLGEYRRAIEYYEQHMTIAREIGDRRGEGNALWNMSLALDELGDRTRAIDCAEAALKIREAIEDPKAEKVRQQLAEWRGQE